MDLFIKILQLLIIIGVVSVFHEFGHYCAARLFGTKVERFQIFLDTPFPLPFNFSFNLWKKKIGETLYGIGWNPMGAYVQIHGMSDEFRSLDDPERAPKSDFNYYYKPNWQKLIIALGGILVNFIYACIIFAFMHFAITKEYIPHDTLASTGVLCSEKAKFYGFQDGDFILDIDGHKPQTLEDISNKALWNANEISVERKQEGQLIRKSIVLPKDNLQEIYDQTWFSPRKQYISIAGIVPQSNAQKAGLKEKDIILKVNQTMISSFDVLKSTLKSNSSHEVSLIVFRENKIIQLKSLVDTAGKLGLINDIIYPKTQYPRSKISLGMAIKHGFRETTNIIQMVSQNLAKMLRGKIKASQNMGFSGVVSIMSPSIDVVFILYMTAVFSALSAFFNFLPIPVLDGGHIVLILSEMILNKKLNPKLKSTVQMIGMGILLGLFLLSIYFDLQKL
ncbi:MAG: RIP metalloprotease RseP [Chitinophagales bacterium]|jgi:regulator of sigma E protease|nr:RIP metalloprotease RseP [Chitinophagales bacterium]